MESVKKKNKKWVVFGSIVVLLAILIAFGPILITKYMRSKWQDGKRYKVANLLMKVDGKLQVSKDNIPYLVGDNDLYYVLENLTDEDLQKNIDSKCSVLGKIKIPKDSQTIDNNDVRFLILVEKIGPLGTIGKSKEKENDKEIDLIKKKAAEKARVRVEVNGVLNKPILFDVARGMLSKETRKKNDGSAVEVVVLTDSFGDKYLLCYKSEFLKDIPNEKVICLGREIMPVKDMPLVVDEITFDIYEMYDSDYHKIM